MAINVLLYSYGLQLRDLEAELENEQRRHREALAQWRKVERLYKEMQTQYDDDRRTLAEISGLNDQLSIKVKTYKRQVDEAVSTQLLFHDICNYEPWNKSLH